MATNDECSYLTSAFYCEDQRKTQTQILSLNKALSGKHVSHLWLIHTARDRDWETMGFYITLCTVHTTQGQGLEYVTIVTGRNEVVAKVMFLHVSVILSTGGVLQAGRGPPGPGRPPLAGRTPPPLGESPLAGRTPPPRGPGRPPPGRRLQNTVYERPVRILLECILVFYCTHPIPCPLSLVPVSVPCSVSEPLEAILGRPSNM